MQSELVLKLRTPRNPFEFRGARTALPQNCSPATLSPVRALVNDTSVPWEWHDEAKGNHVVRRPGLERKEFTGRGHSKSRRMQQVRNKCASLCNFYSVDVLLYLQ